MNSINHKFLLVLGGVLSIAALWTFSAYAAPKNTQKKLLTKAESLAASIAAENRTKQSGIHLESIQFEIGDASELIGQAGEPIHAFTEMKVEKENINVKRASIKFHPNLKNDSHATQAVTILHELAHAYDKSIWDTALTGADDTTFDCYPVLTPEVEYSKRKWQHAEATMSAGEWHAEWQATQWIKKYDPEQVSGLERNYHELKLYQDKFGITSMEYPPAEILLKWLSK